MTASGAWPAEGPARVGSVALPVGRWHYADHDGPPQLVAWVTTEPVAEAGSAWLTLSAEHTLTGLVPVVLTGDTTDVSEAYGVPAAADGLPYFGFHYPAGGALLDLKSAGKELDTGWGKRTVFPSSATVTAPYGRRFPGLAPAGSVPLPAAELRQAVTALPPGSVGLVGGRRPGRPRRPRSYHHGRLRSWESRFGARLLQLGADSILRVLVERPPRTPEHAQQVAAEHIAFADDFDGESDNTVTARATSIIGAPIWSFWWD
jgi:Domain of unknown function (DUF4253)